MDATMASAIMIINMIIKIINVIIIIIITTPRLIMISLMEAIRVMVGFLRNGSISMEKQWTANNRMAIE